MDVKLSKFISAESARLIKHYGNDTDDRTKSLARLAKVTGELGELPSEILSIDTNKALIYLSLLQLIQAVV